MEVKEAIRLMETAIGGGIGSGGGDSSTSIEKEIIKRYFREEYRLRKMDPRDLAILLKDAYDLLQVSHVFKPVDLVQQKNAVGRYDMLSAGPYVVIATDALEVKKQVGNLKRRTRTSPLDITDMVIGVLRGDGLNTYAVDRRCFEPWSA